METQPSSIVRSADHLTQQQAALQGKVKGQITEVSLCLCSLPTGSDRTAVQTSDAQENKSVYENSSKEGECWEKFPVNRKQMWNLPGLTLFSRSFHVAQKHAASPHRRFLHESHVWKSNLNVNRGRSGWTEKLLSSRPKTNPKVLNAAAGASVDALHQVPGAPQSLGQRSERDPETERVLIRAPV